MSTEAALPPTGSAPTRHRGWQWDLRSARIIRYAVGVMIALSIAYAYQWPLYFLTPVLAAFFLSLPVPAPGFKAAVVMMGFILMAFLIGMGFAFLVGPFPLVYVVLLPLGLFHVYYLANRGGPAFLVIMSLIAILLLPMLAVVADALATGATLYFCLSAFLAVMFYFLAHILVPDPVSLGPRPKRPGFSAGYSKTAAQRALKSTMVIVPLALVLLVTNAQGAVLTLIFAAIYSMNPDLSAGKGAAMASMAACVLGGLGGIVFMMLINAVPEFFYMIVAGFLFMLMYASLMFSERPIAKFMPSAATTFIVLVSSSTTDGANFVDNFVIRLGLIFLTMIYIVLSVSILDYYWPRLYSKAN